MRTLRLSVAGVLSAVLALMMSGAAASQQDAGESSGPTGVVVTLSDFAVVSDGEWTGEAEDPSYAGTGITHTYTWEATDPRLSGQATYEGNWLHFASMDSNLESLRWTVVNDAGSWTGTGYSIYSPEAEYGDSASVVLIGDGDYAGLMAYLSFDIAHEEGVGRGLIAEGAMPPFPGLPAE